MAELGTKDLTFLGWFGLLAPVGTPPDILDTLNAEAKAISFSKIINSISGSGRRVVVSKEKRRSGAPRGERPAHWAYAARR
jgi:hypothetical protein